MQELNKATRARVSSVQWGEAKLEAKRWREARLDHLGWAKRNVPSFRLFFIDSVYLFLFLLNGSVSRIKDEPVHFVVSKFYTGERLVSIENFWQKIPVNS